MGKPGAVQTMRAFAALAKSVVAATDIIKASERFIFYDL
jgi:hypothetical protein